jgi:alpha-N-arabinofuranosidase
MCGIGGFTMDFRAAALVLALGLASAPVVATAAPAAAEAPAVRIDAAKPGTPISPFVYGQFIEHLGRSIYGGLWAEMLEDRKFFYPVTGEAPAWEMFKPGPRSYDGEGHPYELLVRSPWMVIGDKKAVSMTARESALAGEHGVQVALDLEQPRGIEQERLALRDGHEYVGRVVLAGGAGPVSVSLVWGGGATMRQTVTISAIRDEWTTHPLRFHAGGTTDNGRLEITAWGDGTLRIGAVSLMPADNVLGWRRDTMARLTELDSPVYRWPGGNFVSGYDWRDGVGDPDRRPPRKNPAWKGVEANDVGLHEFMDLMRMLGSEPYVAVNTGLGGAGSAAELVEYANGAPTTPMGQLRAKNGRTRPFGIRLWAVGNEMYGDWQLGHMPLSKYVEKHKTVVDAMRAADPKIELVAVGGDQRTLRDDAVGEWSRTMLREASGYMSYLSEHLYWQSQPDVPAHVALARDWIRKLADAHHAYRRESPAPAGGYVRIALDEWNYWYGPNEYGELGTRYFLKDGLGIAAGLHEMFRNSDVFYMANYAQTVNVIGAIKTTATEAELEPTGLVLALYRRHFGTLPIAVTDAPAPLDVVAAWTKDRTALTVAIVNPEPAERSVRLDVAGARTTGRGRVFVLTGDSPLAHNAPGHPRGVDVLERPAGGPTEPVDVAPLSVTLLVLETDEPPGEPARPVKSR